MKYDNRGYSLVEMIVVIAIMAILASVGMLSFNSANRQKPDQMRSDLISCGKYERQKTMAEEADQCMLILKAADGYYYVIYGSVPSSDADRSQSNLVSKFTSEYVTTNVVSGDKVRVRDNSKGLTASQLVSSPTSAQNYQALNKNVKITFPDGTEGVPISGSSSYGWIVQFSKFDGSALVGSGTYQFSKYRHYDEVKCETVLSSSTGIFRDPKKN